MSFKKIAIMVAALVCVCSNVYAENVKIDKDGSKITVTTVIEKNKTAMLAVVKDGHTLSDTDWICAIKEGTADENGEVTFEFNMPEMLNDSISDGKYLVYTRQTGKNMEEGSFWYASQTTTGLISTNFIGVMSGDDLKTLLENPDNSVALKGLGFGIDVYNSLATVTDTERTDICNKTFNSIQDFTTTDISDIKDYFNQYTAVAAANSAIGETIIEDALENVNFEFEGVKFNDISDTTLKEWIKSSICKNKTYADVQGLKKQYEAANMLYIINNARFDELTGLLTGYSVPLGLSGDASYIKYAALTSKGSTNEKIAEKLKTAVPSNAKALAAVISECLPKDTPTAGGNSPSGGGGYSGATAENKTPAVVVVPQEPTAATVAFSDISEAKWAEKAINTMTEKEIIVGDGSGKFRPNAPVTREEFVKMIVMTAGVYDEAATCDFTDVVSDKWFYKYIASAVNNGLVYGVDGDEFGVGTTLTRQDMAVICARALKAQKSITAVRADKVFGDEEQISDYAKEDIHTLYSAGLIEGVDEDAFAPREIATRAQAAQMLYKLFIE